jgi:hypothetical protein
MRHIETAAREATICVMIKDVAFVPGQHTASSWVMRPQKHICARAASSTGFKIAQVPDYGTCRVDHHWGCGFTDRRLSASTKFLAAHERVK